MPSAGLISPSRRVARKLFDDDPNDDSVKAHHLSVEQHFNRIFEEERSRARLLYNFDVEKGPVEGGNYDWIAVRGAPGPYIHKPQRNLCPKYPHLNSVYVPQDSIPMDTTDGSSGSISSQRNDMLVHPSSVKAVENNTTPASKHRLRQIKLPELMRISKPKRTELTGKRKRVNDSDLTGRAAKQFRLARL